jgi:hypothetical protein
MLLQSISRYRSVDSQAAKKLESVKGTGFSPYIVRRKKNLGFSP